MKVIIDGVEYVPLHKLRAYLGRLDGAWELYRGDIVFDGRKEWWNFPVDHIETRFGQRILVSQDGRKLNAKHASRYAPKQRCDAAQHSSSEEPK